MANRVPLFLCVHVRVCVPVMVSDYASCLHMLMKYPPIADMQYFIDMARYLREPNVRCRCLTFNVETCVV